MLKLPNLITGFKMLKEVDLNAVRLQAETPLNVLIMGQNRVSQAALAEQLLNVPGSYANTAQAVITTRRAEVIQPVPDDALVLVLLNSKQTDYRNERAVFEILSARKISTVVCYLKSDPCLEDNTIPGGTIWRDASVAVINAIDRDTLIRELAPAILRVSKVRVSRLARHVPMLRVPAVQKLIQDTCRVNAAYSLSTGLAEIVPVLDLPLNLADMVILTKNQALMAYEITLAMGMRAEWRDTMPKLTGVVGTAFLWRQMARYLAGLIPVIGIVPKVIISYSGTYVIGEAIYKWCLNGEKLNRQELKTLYAAALEQGAEAAKVLISRGDIPQQYRAVNIFNNIVRKNQNVYLQSISVSRNLFTPAVKCSVCGKKAPKGADFCAFCGKPLNS